MTTAFLILFSALFGASVVTAAVTYFMMIYDWRGHAIGAVVCAALVAAILLKGTP